MAFADLHASAEAATTEGWWDVTHRGFERVVADLLPRGAAWNRDGATLRKTVASLATELSRIDIRGRKLLRELDPSTTFELLVEWEEMLGLPDCAAPETLEARRAAVKAKLLAQTGHDQSLTYWTEMLEALGYELEWVEKGHEALTCIDDCNDILFDEEWMFVWALVVESGIDDALLACVLGKQALLETLASVHLLWQLYDGPVSGDEDFRGIASTMNGHTVIVGLAGVVFKASDNLASWTPIAPPTANDFYAVCHAGAAGNRLIAGGTLGSVWYSDNGGTSWTQVVSATINRDIYGLSRGPGNDDVVVAVGDSGKIFRSVNAGASWSSITSPTADPLRAVTRCAGALVAVGLDGQIIRSVDEGASWGTIVAGGGATLLGVSAWGETVVAVGSSGTLRRSRDAGVSWETLTVPTSDALTAVTSSPSGRWTACGATGAIIQSLDDGVTWVLRETTSSSPLAAAGASWPLGRAVVAGETGNIILE